MSYDRLTPDNAALLLVDHQTGLSNGVQDQSVPEYTTSVTALVKLAKAFKLPTVITTSASDGPNGPVLPIITETLPNAPVIHRPGEINAWDNPAFVAAVKKTGRKKLIVAGVSTEVCVAFVALSAIKEGYEVYAVIDASGTWNKLVQQTAVARMAQAGIVPITWLAVAAELQADWRKPTGAGPRRYHGRTCAVLRESLPQLPRGEEYRQSCLIERGGPGRRITARGSTCAAWTCCRSTDHKIMKTTRFHTFSYWISTASTERVHDRPRHLLSNI